MKIFPRSFVVHEGNAAPTINIRNSAADDRVLMFKIRRSELKMVEFSPKFGYVEAGTTCTIRLKVVDYTIPRTKLLVKLVVLKKSLFKDDFEDNWRCASDRNGEVKKIIDITSAGTESGADPHRKESTSSPSRRHVNKQVRVGHSTAQGVGRARSNDSFDAHSVLSEMSCSIQSLQSGAFYSPSMASSYSSPHGSNSAHRGRFVSHDGSSLVGSPEVRRSEQGDRSQPDHMSVSGSAFEFDSYSLAESALETSGVVCPSTNGAAAGSVSTFAAAAVSASPEPSLLPVDERTSKGPPPRSEFTGATTSTESDRSALAELLQRIAHSPNTATLLMGLLRSVEGSTTARHPPHQTAQLQFSSAPKRDPQLSPPSSVGNSENRPVKLSRAEQLRRFIEAEDGAAFPSVRQAHTDKAQEYNDGEGESKVDEAALDDCSRLISLGAAKGRAVQNDSGRAVMLEVCGGDAEDSQRGWRVSDEEFVRLVEARLEEAVENRARVAAVQVTTCRISSLAASFGALFHPTQTQKADHTKSEEGEPQALRDKLISLRAAFLEDGLRHLSVNDCALSAVDASVNRFRHLLSLNLADCRIQQITAPLQLPYLRSLDLSNNQITSLDYLQLLTSLCSLHVANNRIASLSVSVNMLVSLSRTLAVLDMSGNPVCRDHHYAQEVVHVLPRLKVFDGCDLQAMSQAYTYSHAARRGPASSRASSAPRSGGTPLRSYSRRRLPELPADARKARGTLPSPQESRRDFERRLRSALLHRQRGIHAAPTAAHGVAEQLSPTQRNSSTEERSVGGGRGRYTDSDDEQELEIQSAVDSIQELSRSFSERSFLRTRPHGGTPSDSRSALPADDSVGKDGATAAAPAPAPAPAPALARLRSDGAFSASPPPATPAPATAPVLIQRWGEHPTSREVTGFARAEVPLIDDSSTLLDGTESLRLRRQLHGVADRSTRFPEHAHYAPHGSMYSSASLQSRGRIALVSSAGRRRSGSGSGFGASLTASAEFPSPPTAGAARSVDDEGRGYFSESEVQSRRSRAAAGAATARKAAKISTLSEEQFMEMQEHERYGYWHTRYRVPKPVFGFSRPFAHRHRPSLKDHAPLFEATVQRLRNGFRLAPARGTFPRAGKGLPSEWYPMDVEELDAVRRHGYFNETIGEVTQGSFRDASAKTELRPATGSHSWSELQGISAVLPGNSGTLGSGAQRRGAQGAAAAFLTEAHVSPRGSTSISPQRPGRRHSWGPHMSRFDPAASVVQLPDDFSGFRKWHQGLFDAVHDSQHERDAFGQEFPSGESPGDVEVSSSFQRGLAVGPDHDGARRSASAEIPSPHSVDITRGSREELRARRDFADSRQAAGNSAPSPPVAPRLDHHQQQQRASPPRFNSSFEEDCRVYAALPDFPEPPLSEPDHRHRASSADYEAGHRGTPPPLLPEPASSPVGPEDVDDTLLSPSLQQLSAIAEKIDAEEAELAHYLSWLEAQQHPAPPPTVVSAASAVRTAVVHEPAPSLEGPPLEGKASSRTPPLPAEAAAAATRLRVDTATRSPGATGIPRYVPTTTRSGPIAASHRAISADDRHNTGPGPRSVVPDRGFSDHVFSPRDAAMRAEQPPDDTDAHRDLKAIKVGRSAFQSHMY